MGLANGDDKLCSTTLNTSDAFVSLEPFNISSLTKVIILSL